MTEAMPEADALSPTEATLAQPAAPAAPAALAAAKAPRQARGGRGGHRGPAAKAAPANAGARKPHPILERLFALYPNMFGARFRPLKLGVFQELMALHGEEFKKDELKLALGQHARSTRYLEAVASGDKRHDLQGNPVEDLAPEHIHHAILEVHKRRQARSKDDLRPQLRQRMVRAIEASGLDREAYTAIARSNDETANAVLEEAFAEIGAGAAKREAMGRAFEASGRSVAAFAEMYGLDAAEVQRMVGGDKA
jgi:ProP effector